MPERGGGQADDRYLWPEMLRVIGEVRPTWVIGENVAGITTMVEQCRITEMGSQASLFEEDNGVHRYNAEYTFTIERVCSDLESMGYSVQPMLIPACAVGAPHRRDRVFFIAYNVADSADKGSMRDSRANAAKEGKERISERNEVQWTDESADARSEMQSSSTNTFGGGSESLKEGEGIEGNRRATISQQSEWRDQTEWVDGLFRIPQSASDTDCDRGREIHQHLQSQESDGAEFICDGWKRYATDTGTGYAISLVDGKEIFDKRKDANLPAEIEGMYPDYSLYPALTQDTAYGFLTRGCPRGCDFCIVGKKEGRCSVKVADLNQFWGGAEKHSAVRPKYLGLQGMEKPLAAADRQQGEGRFQSRP